MKWYKQLTEGEKMILWGIIIAVGFLPAVRFIAKLAKAIAAIL